MAENETETWGGVRANAGRKKGSSVYGESTQAMRIPESLIPTVKSLLQHKQNNVQHCSNIAHSLRPAANLSALALPLFSGKVSAGFPSPADDFVDKTLDLNELLIQNPAATFFTRVQGDSMIGAGIFNNDILVVNRALTPAAGKIVICALNGELTVKRLMVDNGQWYLKAENPDYPNIPLYDELEMVVWGVVTEVIHKV